MKMKKRTFQYPLIFTSALLFFINHSNAYGLDFKINDYEKKIKTSYSVRNVSEKISTKDLEDYLREFLSKSRPSRIVGTPGHEKARDYILKELKANKSDKSEVLVQKFAISPEVTSKLKLKPEHLGENIVWRKKGSTSPEAEIILSANYDTIFEEGSKSALSESMPGADNNASGVILLLSLAKVLDQLDIPKTVSIVFFDVEDRFNEGSKNYLLQNTFDSALLGHISVCMIGHDSKVQDKEKKYNNFKIYKNPNNTTAKNEALMSDLFINLGKSNYPQLTMTLMPLLNHQIGDSSKSFWDKGISSLVFTQDRENDLNPRLRTGNDFAETLNYSSFSFVYKYLTSGVISWNYNIVK